MKTARELRDHLIRICDEGYGDLPVSRSQYDATLALLPPRVIYVAEDGGGKLYFSASDVRGGAPETRGLPTPKPTFVFVG